MVRNFRITDECAGTVFSPCQQHGEEEQFACGGSLEKSNSSGAREFTGKWARNPVFFVVMWHHGSPKYGLGFHGCGPRSGKLVYKCRQEGHGTNESLMGTSKRTQTVMFEVVLEDEVGKMCARLQREFD